MALYIISDGIHDVLPTDGSDFVAQGQVLVFSSSNLLFAVSITPLDDNETEGEESLTASLSFVGAGAVLLDPATAEINIIDNECKCR